MQLLESFQPSLVVMELHLPDTDGVELLRSLAARGCTANVVLIGNVDERVLSAAHELGLSHGLAMCGTLEKPIAEDSEIKVTHEISPDWATRFALWNGSATAKPFNALVRKPR